LSHRHLQVLYFVFLTTAQYQFVWSSPKCILSTTNIN